MSVAGCWRCYEVVIAVASSRDYARKAGVRRSANTPHLIDHVIYVDPDLERGIQTFANEYGVAAVPGGSHRGIGTKNALIGLRSPAYLEVMGIDDDQDVVPANRPFALDRTSVPRFVAWCARAARPLEQTLAIARAAGLDLGEILAMSRRRPDGSTFSWTMTSPWARRYDVLPFYIDWGDGDSPAASLPPALTLTSLTLVHPQSERIRAMLEALGEDEVTVEKGSAPELKVRLHR
jgi:Glyoxalase-like domain